MSTSTAEHSGMEETGAPATAEEIQDEVGTMGLDSKPDSEINGQSEVCLYVISPPSRPNTGGTNGTPHAQVGAGPSKSAKKKAKKKAAAARKADAAETNGTEGLEEAGTSNGNAESNGIQPAETNGPSGKKKSKTGMVILQESYHTVTRISLTCIATWCCACSNQSS